MANTIRLLQTKSVNVIDTVFQQQQHATSIMLLQLTYISKQVFILNMSMLPFFSFFFICLLKDYRALREAVGVNVGDIWARYRMDREPPAIDPLIFCQPGNENKPTKDVTLKRAKMKQFLVS